MTKPVTCFSMSPFYLLIHANSYLEVDGLLNLDSFWQSAGFSVYRPFSHWHAAISTIRWKRCGVGNKEPALQSAGIDCGRESLGLGLHMLEEVNVWKNRRYRTHKSYNIQYFLFRYFPVPESQQNNMVNAGCIHFQYVLTFEEYWQIKLFCVFHICVL